MKKQSELAGMLNSLPKEELVRIILRIAEEDDKIGAQLIVKYGTGKAVHQLKARKKLIKSIIDKYSGDEEFGFIRYGEERAFALDMLSILEDDMNNETLALDTALLVLEEGISAFQYADDSDGDIGMLVEETIAGIQKIAARMREDVLSGEHCFQRLLTMSNGSLFDGWNDYRIDLLRICADFADDEKHRKQLKKVIEQRIAAGADNESMRYTIESLYKLLFQIICDYGSDAEAERFVQDHLSVTFFREWSIEKSMAGGNYAHVIELAEAGEQQDHHYAGLLSKWKAFRYQAYKKLSLRKQQEMLARELLLDGDYNYYHDLESLHEEDKEAFYHEIIAELKTSKNWRARSVYVELISDKNDLDELMAYVRTNPSEVEKYGDRLLARYSADVQQICSDYVFNAAGKASNRKEYREICGILRSCKKMLGTANRSAIIAKLKTEYSRRPAFLDELSHIK
ncbi:hypothetical protein [Sporolactobacillus nakayamae]|uniref:Uncharacterized protein n=1 Tax=Sporolactobacillus nakayamae TaxID=269670 RepID=A0A1I2PNW0_9BACL|nr:hypothetical protein [Sporolactobacillus nakayamae]SFG17724.1 hypothetical protein SAMN02982927_00913 [Sporolactobacillus nakayamae]